MKKLLFLFVLFSAPLCAQQQNASYSNPVGGDITASGANCGNSKVCVWQKLPSNASTTSVTIVGTFSETLIIELSGDGGNTFIQQSSQTTATTVSFSSGGYSDVRVRCSAFTSGTASVTITTTSGGGGGGGGGSLHGAGAPSNPCTAGVTYTNDSNGDYYSCNAGSYLKVNAAGGNPAFSSVTAGTNTAALVVGAGGSLTVSGTGTNNANQINGAAPPLTKTIVGTNGSGQLIDATASTLANNTSGSAASFTGNLIGDVSGTQGATVVGKINGTSMAGLATGIIKNTTVTGVPSIAVAVDFPTLNQNTSGTAANLSGTPALPNGTTGTTQAAADNTTKLATDAFVITNDTVQTNGVSNVTLTGVNFLTSTANTAGMTITPSNPSTTGERFELAGILNATSGGNGLSNPGAHSFELAEGANPINLLSSPSTNGYYFCAFNVSGGVQVDPTCNLAGVPVNAQSSSYSLLYSDRANYIKESGGTTATLTLPQVIGNVASNFPFVTQNLNSGNETITANAADKIDNGATGSSQTVLPNWAAWVYQDSSSAPGNWWTIRVPSFAAFGANCGDTSHAINWSTTTGFGCQAITASATAGGSNTQLQYNNATALGGISGWTTNGTTTMTGGSTSVLDLSSMAPASGLKIPGVAGGVPTADDFIGYNLTTHAHVWGSNGTTIVGAAAATGTNTATTCTNQFVSVISAVAAPTCATVTGASMASNTVAATQLAVVQTTRTCDIGIGDTSGSAITNAQLGPQIKVCQIPFAATISEIDVSADGGTPNVIVAKRHCTASPCVVGANETVSNLVSSALATASSGGTACSKTGATAGLDTFTTCSATLQNTSLAVGDFIELVSGTAGGTAKWMNIHIIYTVN